MLPVGDTQTAVRGVVRKALRLAREENARDKRLTVQGESSVRKAPSAPCLDVATVVKAKTFGTVAKGLLPEPAATEFLVSKEAELKEKRVSAPFVCVDLRRRMLR